MTPTVDSRGRTTPRPGQSLTTSHTHVQAHTPVRAHLTHTRSSPPAACPPRCTHTTLSLSRSITLEHVRWAKREKPTSNRSNAPSVARVGRCWGWRVGGSIAGRVEAKRHKEINKQNQIDKDRDKDSDNDKDKNPTNPCTLENWSKFNEPAVVSQQEQWLQFEKTPPAPQTPKKLMVKISKVKATRANFKCEAVDKACNTVYLVKVTYSNDELKTNPDSHFFFELNVGKISLCTRRRMYIISCVVLFSRRWSGHVFRPRRLRPALVQLGISTCEWE